MHAKYTHKQKQINKHFKYYSAVNCDCNKLSCIYQQLHIKCIQLQVIYINNLSYTFR